MISSISCATHAQSAQPTSSTQQSKASHKSEQSKPASGKTDGDTVTLSPAAQAHMAAAKATEK